MSMKKMIFACSILLIPTLSAAEEVTLLPQINHLAAVAAAERAKAQQNGAATAQAARDALQHAKDVAQNAQDQARANTKTITDPLQGAKDYICRLAGIGPNGVVISQHIPLQVGQMSGSADFQTHNDENGNALTVHVQITRGDKTNVADYQLIDPATGKSIQDNANQQLTSVQNDLRCYDYGALPQDQSYNWDAPMDEGKIPDAAALPVQAAPIAAPAAAAAN